MGKGKTGIVPPETGLILGQSAWPDEVVRHVRRKMEAWLVWGPDELELF